MKKTSLIGTLTLAVIITAGCNKSSTETVGDTNSVSTNESAGMTASNGWQNAKEMGSNGWTATKNATSNAWEATKDATTNAWEKTKETLTRESGEGSTNYFGYDYSMKDSFVSEANTNLYYLDQKASPFSDKVSSATGDSKADLQQKLQEVNARRADAGRKLDDVKNASLDNWNDAKAAFIKAYYDLKASLKAGRDSAAAGS